MAILQQLFPLLCLASASLFGGAICQFGALAQPGCTSLTRPMDFLFVLDSSPNVPNVPSHQLLLQFVADLVQRLQQHIEIEHSFSVVQFTPEMRVEFGPSEAAKLACPADVNSPASRERLRQRILNIAYVPCAPFLCTTAVSLNTIVKQFLDDQPAYRAAAVPDIVIVVSTARYRPPEINAGEAPFQPQAPIHVFDVRIGQSQPPPVDAFQPISFATTTAHLAAAEFASLPGLVQPLCESIHSVVANSTSSSSLCLLCLLLLAICSAILCGALAYACHRFWRERNRYRLLLDAEKDKVRRLDEQYCAKFGELYTGIGERTLSELPSDHPAASLAPVDVLLLVDSSASIGNSAFEQIKAFLCSFVSDIDIAPGRSRVAAVVFAAEPQLQFDFDRYYTQGAVRVAIRRMPYLGDVTRLAKALTFASGMLARERAENGEHAQNGFASNRRLQVVVLVSDGATDERFERQASVLQQRWTVKMAAVATRNFHRKRLSAAIKHEAAIFTLDQLESLSIWLWSQQKLYTQSCDGRMGREKTNLSFKEVESKDDK